MNIAFTVPGRPVPAARMTQRGTFLARSQKYLAYKEEVGWLAKEAMNGRNPTDGCILVEIWAYVSGKKPGDIDNIAKSILDGMNKIVYLDDRQVIDLIIHRRNALPERAEIMVRRV